MSCQQLVQEDPYVFTDNVSNTTTFMQQNNSQTKYVPLSRQTIYSRQFRQHEPSIDSSENISINGRQPPKQKIIISASAVSHKKNGHTNGFATKSPPAAQPKFSKSHQLPVDFFKVPDGQYLVNNCNKSTTHHSITVSSQPAPSDQQQQLECASQLNHVSTTCENGINNITGINQGPLNGKSHTISSRARTGPHPKRLEKSSKCRTNSKRSKLEKFAVVQCPLKSRAKTQKVIVEPVHLPSRCAPEVQLRSLLDTSIFHVPSRSPLHHLESDTFQRLSRDERLVQKKVQLRRRLEQFKGIHGYRTTERSRLRFSETLKLLRRLDRAKDEIFRRPFKICQFEDCEREAMFSTHHCTDHILLADKEQHLIRQCCFLYSHGEQCRVPVLDVMAAVAVCNEHEDAPIHQLIDPAKPKKTSQLPRKRTVKPPMIRPGKKNGKIGKKNPVTKPAIVPGHRPTMIIHPHDIQKPTVKLTQPQLQKQEIPLESHQFIHQNSGNLLASSQSSYGSMTSEDLYLKQDLMTICENSYESSEDTGVGGLSENELMPHDIVGAFDMESCAELTKVLSSLPTNTLDDLLTEPLQTSRDDEEYLDRAIEEVSSVGMDQIAIAAFDTLDGLGDMLEMMDDEEQRQMISAATNLISMSGMQSFLSNHDQDYSAMPSPMMS